MERARVHITTKARRSWVLEAIKNIRGADNMVVTIEPYVEKKTDEQRAFFHVLCRKMVEDTGYTEAQIKEAIKKMVLGTETLQIGDRAVEVTSSSERDAEGNPRSKPSYSELIEGAYQLAGEAGITLPGAV